MKDLTVESVKAIFERHTSETAGESFLLIGKFLRAGQEPTEDEEDHMLKLAGKCEALTALGQELGWIPLTNPRG